MESVLESRLLNIKYQHSKPTLRTKAKKIKGRNGLLSKWPILQSLDSTRLDPATSLHLFSTCTIPLKCCHRHRSAVVGPLLSFTPPLLADFTVAAMVLPPEQHRISNDFLC